MPIRIFLLMILMSAQLMGVLSLGSYGQTWVHSEQPVNECCPLCEFMEQMGGCDCGCVLSENPLPKSPDQPPLERSTERYKPTNREHLSVVYAVATTNDRIGSTHNGVCSHSVLGHGHEFLARTGHWII